MPLVSLRLICWYSTKYKSDAVISERKSLLIDMLTAKRGRFHDMYVQRKRNDIDLFFLINLTKTLFVNTAVGSNI